MVNNMKEKIETFNKEVNSISEVLEKLLTKQNSSVFDKLCVKCNDLLERIKSFYPDYQDNLIAVPEEAIIEESKPVIQEYIIAVDKLSLSVDFYLNRLKATVNQDISLE